jgi:hypothetical protein
VADHFTASMHTPFVPALQIHRSRSAPTSGHVLSVTALHPKPVHSAFVNAENVAPGVKTLPPGAIRPGMGTRERPRSSTFPVSLIPSFCSFPGVEGVAVSAAWISKESPHKFNNSTPMSRSLEALNDPRVEFMTRFLSFHRELLLSVNQSIAGT